MTRKRNNYTFEEKMAILTVRLHSAIGSGPSPSTSTRACSAAFTPSAKPRDNTLDLWASYHRLPIAQAAQSIAEIFTPGLTSTDKSVTEERNP